MLGLLGNRLDPKFCPHKPHPKQSLFLSLDCEEALYGGAAGGGKSDALLMAFLQYADRPGYRGLILRRKRADLTRGDAILNRACHWWLPYKKTGVRFSAKDLCFTFPSGATCEFGHANNERDVVENYQGGAWQFIAFDELTQFTPNQYLYLFSRLRRSTDGVLIPPRIRAAANPGGISHAFVRDRFMSLEYARAFLDGKAEPFYAKEYIQEDDNGRPEINKRYFVPAKTHDNAHLDGANYRRQLRQLATVTRDQLLSGDWLISTSGRFKPHWFRRYKHPDFLPASSGGYYVVVNPDGSILHQVQPNSCLRYITVDPAGTERDQELSVKSGSIASWTVINVWDYDESRGFLFLRSVKRMQREFPEVMAAIKSEYQIHRPSSIFIEFDGIGKIYFQALQRDRLPVLALKTEGKDKVVRAIPAVEEAERGNIILPEYADWLSAWEAEVFMWQGISRELNDQVDAMAWGVNVKVNRYASPMVLQ